MNPPEEQLIRDYLNRVSVAARGCLSPEDRRSFVTRTRELIEQNTRGAGQVGPMGVARFLNGLGDPAALVARECDRLTARPLGSPFPPPAEGIPRRPRLSRPRRPRPARSRWIDRLRPSGGPLTGVPVPRPAATGGDAPGGDTPGSDAPGSDAPGSKVLAGDVVTGHVPTGDEPIPGPASESVSRPVPEPPPGPVPAGAERASDEAPGPVPQPSDVWPSTYRPWWPWQDTDGTAADPAAAPNGGGPAASERSPGSLNGSPPVNGHASVTGMGASDFTAEELAEPEVVEAGREAPEGSGPASPESADPAQTGREIGETRGGVGDWAGWKPPPDARPRPAVSRLPLPRLSVSRPSWFRASAARPSAAGPPGMGPSGMGPSAAGPSGAGPSATRPSRLRPSMPPGALSAAGAGALSAVGVGARKAARYTAVRARERPLEAVAVVLIGLGGAVYPPVWLLGAALALASRVWDFRDKWLGLAIPLFAVIVGMGADVSLSGAQHSVTAYFREAWIFGGHLSRIVALLGAAYLAWRSQQPRRPQSAEPWKKQRRFN